MRTKFYIAIALMAVFATALTACTSRGPSDDLKVSVVNNYADGAYAS